MNFIEQKVKHLEMIQDVVKRMASNSFQLKTWTIGIISAVFALMDKSQVFYLMPILIVPVFLFWGLDAYFLRLERLYRQLYEDVRQRQEGVDNIDFSLDYRSYEMQEKTWFQVVKSRTLLVFYGMLSLVIICLIVAKIFPV
ncbi:hypothetical protein [Thiothrix subterranea]|uniref:Uncharacterized protein n=1 Tax=Thiothrix subterranea TaxID=2735563 RepID=A0AA51MKB0_9GAMM|nr:hypothetical protein [Thiothrix subterranea]MDQ5770982.1 hypothetical protein [Thiothrix subterranea]WML85274.1 hypothetical protein RCG00_13310 [Thiothrix subterranea]